MKNILQNIITRVLQIFDVIIMTERFKIPLELGNYVISNSLIKPFKLYLILKSRCSGQIKLDTADFEQLATILDYKSIKSIRNNLTILIKLNWVGYNKKSGLYFVRGFDYIRKKHQFNRRTAIFLELSQIIYLQELLLAGLITKLIKNRIRDIIKNVDCKGRRSNQAFRNIPDFFPISASYLAKILNISINKAFRIKRSAAALKYITIQPNLISTKFAIGSKLYLNKLEYPEANKVRVKKGFLVIQECDLVKANIPLAVRKKIESY